MEEMATYEIQAEMARIRGEITEALKTRNNTELLLDLMGELSHATSLFADRLKG